MVLQHDLLDDLTTRVVAPLVPVASRGHAARGLNPQIWIGDSPYALLVEYPAAATERELGTHVMSAAYARDEIIRALDILFTGV